MDFSELDQTQAITFDHVDEEDLTDELDSDGTKKPVAHLKVLLQPGLKETTYPLYEGDNIVGRSHDSCHIWISSKSLSKEHACIQIINNVHMIFDKQSRNKTRRGKLFLQPEVRYELKSKDEIYFADVKCIYLIENEESCLMSPNQLDKPNVLAANTPEKEKLTSEKTLFVAESESEEEDENFQKRIEETVLLDDESDPDQSCDQEVYYAATQPYGLLGNHNDDDDASNLSEKSAQEQKEEKVKITADVKSVLKQKDGQVNEQSDGTTAGELNSSHLDSDVPCHFSMSTLACDKTVLENQTSNSEEAAVDDDGPASHCETVMLTETAEIERSQAKYHQTELNNNKSKIFKLQKRKTEKVETEANGDKNGTLVLEESLSQQSNEDEVPAKMARRSSARRGRQQVTARGRQIKSRQSTVKTQDLEASDSLKPKEKTTTDDNLTDLKTCVLAEETQESDKSTDNEEDFDVCEPTQAYTMDCGKPTQAYTSGSDEPTQVYPKDLDEPTQVYPKVLDEPTQVYPKGFDEPTQVESIEEPTQVYPKGGLDEPTQVYPKGFDESTQEDSLEELLQADPKGFEEPTQAYAKDFDSSSDTAEDQDETQKFDLLEDNATVTHENDEDQTEKVNNEDMIVEDSVSEDDSDLEAESVLKPDLAELNCEDNEVDDDSFSMGHKMLHLDVTKSFEDNMNISPIIEFQQMKEKSQEVQIKAKSPVKASSSKRLFNGTVTSLVKSPYKSALASKRGPTSPTPKHVAFTEDTKKDSQLNLERSSPSDTMSPQRQASSSASNGHGKDETSTGEVRNAFENSEGIEEQKVTLQQPDTVGDTPQTRESPSLEMSSTAPKKRGRKPKVRLDPSWDEASSRETKSKQTETSIGESSVHTVGANQIPEKTEDDVVNSVKAVNEESDGTEVISITTESSSLGNSSTVQKRRGRKPKVNLDSTEIETPSKGTKSKQVKTSSGNSSVQAEENQTAQKGLENVNLAEDEAVGGVQVVNKPTHTTNEMAKTPQTAESPAVENSSSLQKRRGRKPKVKLDSSEAQIDSSDTKSKQEETRRRESRKSAGRSLFQADPNITPENRIENVGLTEEMSAGNVEVINERTDNVEVLTTESPTIEIVAAVQKRRGRKPKVNVDSAEIETISNDAKSKQTKTTVGESSVQADANQTPENRLENVEKSADSVESEQTSGAEEMEINTTDLTSIVVEGSSSTEDFKLSATEENVCVSTRRKRVSSHPAYLKDFETATPKASKKETAVSKSSKKDSKSKPDVESPTEPAVSKALKKDSKSKPDVESPTEPAVSKALKKDSKSKPDVESPTEPAVSKALKKDSKSKPDVESPTETATPNALKKDSKSNSKASVEESVDNPEPIQSRGRKSNRGNKNSTAPTQLLVREITTQKALKQSEDLEDFTNISPPKKARITNVPTSKTSLRKSKNLNESTSATSTKNVDNSDEFTSANAPIDVDKSISTKSTTSPTPKGSLRGQSLMVQPQAQEEDKKVKSGGKSTPGRGQRKNTEQSSQSDSEMSVTSSSSTAETASSSKKPSSQNKGDKAISSQTLRRSSLCQKPKVMFTGLVDEPREKIVKDLGGEIATAIQNCTHLVTDKIRRTVKFLSGLSKGIPIVTPLWLENSKRAGTFLDGHKFLVSDAAIEKQYKFSLSMSITKAASGGGLLKDYKVHVTKSVTPTPDQMQEILLCAGAVYLKTMPKSASENTIVISCPDDKKLCQPAIKAGIPVVGTEFILTGILRQEVDFKSFSLFTEESTPVEKRKRK